MDGVRLFVLMLVGATLGCDGQRTAWSAQPPLLPKVAGMSALAPPAHSSGSSHSPAVRANDPPVQPAVYRDSKPPRSSDGAVAASVMARVNGHPILAEEVVNAASGRLAQARQQVSADQWPKIQAEIIKNELEQIIDRELLLQDAGARINPKALEKVKEAADKDFDSLLRKQRSALNLKSDEELKLYLEKQGWSIDEMRRQHTRSYMAMEYLRNLVRPKLEEIDREQMLEYYRQNLKEFEKPERVTWQHIFIDKFVFPNPDDARLLAEQVHAKARTMATKEEFAALAEDAAVNRSPSRFRKGEGEGNERGLIRPPDVEDLVFRLAPGQVGPVVETPNGYHIVRVVDHTPGGKVPFERACGDIRNKLRNKIGQQEFQRVLKELRAKAHIENSVSR